MRLRPNLILGLVGFGWLRNPVDWGVPRIFHAVRGDIANRVSDSFDYPGSDDVRVTRLVHDFLLRQHFTAAGTRCEGVCLGYTGRFNRC